MERGGKKERSGLASSITDAFALAGKMKEAKVTYYNGIPNLDGEIKHQPLPKRKTK